MEIKKTNLKENQLWNERFQKSIFDLTDGERAILKKEAQERRAKKNENSSSINLMNLSKKSISRLEDAASKSNVNIIHSSNSVKVSGDFESMKSFLKNSGISNNANYLFGMKTSY